MYVLHFNVAKKFHTIEEWNEAKLKASNVKQHVVEHLKNRAFYNKSAAKADAKTAATLTAETVPELNAGSAV